MRLAPITAIHTSLLFTLAVPAAIAAPENPAPAPSPLRTRAVRAAQSAPAAPVAPTAPTVGEPFARLEIRPQEADYRVYEQQVERAEKDVAVIERRLQDLRARGFLAQTPAAPGGDTLEREVRNREEQLRAAQKALADARSRLMQERVRSATRTFTPSAPTLFYQVQAAPVSPEMARKTASLMALRSVVQMGLTRAEIEAALPVLRQLQEGSAALKSASEQALEEERAALLAAKPGQVPAATSSEQLRQASNRYREEQRKAWEALAKAIGAQKSAGLRRLLGEAGTIRVQSSSTRSADADAAATTVRDRVLTLPDLTFVDPTIAIAGAGNSFTLFRGSTVSLAELIDLLTQRAAALKE